MFDIFAVFLTPGWIVCCVCMRCAAVSRAICLWKNSTAHVGLNKWKRQLMPWYYYYENFDLLDALKESPGPSGFSGSHFENHWLYSCFAGATGIIITTYLRVCVSSTVLSVFASHWFNPHNSPLRWEQRNQNAGASWYPALICAVVWSLDLGISNEGLYSFYWRRWVRSAIHSWHIYTYLKLSNDPVGQAQSTVLLY